MLGPVLDVRRKTPKMAIIIYYIVVKTMEFTTKRRNEGNRKLCFAACCVVRVFAFVFRTTSPYWLIE